MSEEWRAVPGYEGAYEVSDLGRVRSVDRRDELGRTRRGVVLKPSVRADGHAQVALSREGRVRAAKVHVLVAAAFLGARPSGLDIRHVNGDGLDNRLENIRYGTRRDNLLDAVEHGTHAMTKRTTCPRGHALVEPNLVESARALGHRQCKACARERARAHRRGAFDPARADKQYQTITEGAAA